MNWHAKFGAVLAIFDFSKKVRGRSCPQPFMSTYIILCTYIMYVYNVCT